MAAENHHPPYKKSKEVSAMIKQGFISDPFLSPPSRPQLSLSRTPLSPSHSVSPPPSYAPDQTSPARTTRQSPTLFEMMSEEQTRESKQSIEARIKLNERVSRVLETAPFRDPGKWGGFGDVRLAISGSDGFRVSMDVHRRVLADRSQFFAEKLRRQSTAVEADVEAYATTTMWRGM